MRSRPKPSLPRPVLCLVTDRSYAQTRTLPATVTMSLDGSVNMVQLREKDLPRGELLSLARQIRRVTQDKALFLVNERVDVALAAGADGVQLGEEALPVQTVRDLVGDRLLIGRSVHSVEGAQEAEEQGADFLVVGTIFPTVSKPDAEPAGLALLSRIAGAVRIPFLAIGGINRDNIALAMERGCSGVAVVSAILAAADPGRASRELEAAMVQVIMPHKEAARRGQPLAGR